jgi:hypothetical protein
MESFRKYVYLTVGFILVILVGYFLNENVKKVTAKRIGYDTYYIPAMGRCTYYNYTIDSTLKNIHDEYLKSGDTSQAFRKDKEWVKLIKIDTRNFAIIESSGYLFTFFVSLIGFLIWFIRRKKKLIIKWLDWLSLILSLFFMREILVIGYLFWHGILCNEKKLWDFFGLNWYYTYITLFIFGIIWLIFILIRVLPKEYRLKFIVSGFLGCIIGFYLVTRFIGYLI